MIGIFFCILAFGVTYVRGRRSLGAGFGALLAVGYGHGLVRARVGDVASHFLFDMALLGLYAACFTGKMSEELRLRTQTATSWTFALVAWPLVCVAYSPFLGAAQPIIVQLVGLRDVVFMLPCVILGARMRREDFDVLAPTLAVLNIIALGFGTFEYFYGIEPIFPRTLDTALMYESKDVTGGGGTFFRIPATFLSAHAYGGTVVFSVPFVSHGLESGRRVRLLCWAGLGAAVVGTFLCGARFPVITLGVATVYVVGSLRMRLSTIFGFAVAAIAVGYLVTNVDRFQRFTTLSDSAMVRNRVAMSINMGFFDVLANYPLGSGLASSAGTSIPGFLAATPGLHRPIGVENEYARIVLEEGVLGLLLWISLFVTATFTRKRVGEASPTASLYMRALGGIMWLCASMGTGLLYAAPVTPIFFVALGMGLAAPAKALTTRPLREARAQPHRLPRREAAALAVPRLSR